MDFNKKYYASYDAANKTLAHCVIRIDDIYSSLVSAYAHWQKIKLNLLDPGINTELKYIKHLLQFITFYDYAVTDILDGKKVKSTTDLEKTQSAINYLKTHTPEIIPLVHDSNNSNNSNNNIDIIVEHQPSINSTSPIIEHVIVTYYMINNYNVLLVNGKNKNNINFDKTFNEYLIEQLAKIPPEKSNKELKDARKKAKYNARKLHSKENFIHFCNTMGYEHIILMTKSSVLDDLADSFWQAIAYHFGF